ncbi:MAG: oligosaccharide flippase family protein [Proteobacteria bacterium]|nr:oligosaccharide flippase family protein [Pseudomonadota bacterium]
MLRATLTLLAGGALAQAMPLLLGPWIARLYTPAEFGLFSLWWQVAANVAAVGCLRYEFALPLARSPADARALLALCLRVALAVLLAAVLLAAALGLLRPVAERPLWAWLPLAAAVGMASQTLTLWAVRGERHRAQALARVVQWGGAPVVQVALGLAAAGVAGLMAGPLLAGVAACLVLAWPAPEGGWRGLWQVPAADWRAQARQHADFPRYNAPHAFVSALQDTLALAVLAWAIGGEAGVAAAGIWALVLRYLKAPATLVGGAVSQVLYPRLTAVSSPQAAQALVRRMLGLLGLLGALLALALMLVGSWLFTWLLGPDWAASGPLVRALALYIGLHFVAAPLSVVPMALGGQRWALRMAVAGQVLFVAALLVGVHLGGLAGAGWAVSAAMALYFGWFFAVLATGTMPR